VSTGRTYTREQRGVPRMRGGLDERMRSRPGAGARRWRAGGAPVRTLMHTPMRDLC